MRDFQRILSVQYTSIFYNRYSTIVPDRSGSSFAAPHRSQLKARAARNAPRKPRRAPTRALWTAGVEAVTAARSLGRRQPKRPWGAAGTERLRD